MKTVTITKMATGCKKEVEFATEKEARSYFYEKCDLENIDYQMGDTCAGGIGHDYRIELN